MSVDDLATLDGNKCILQVRGLRPFLSDKYDITKHPNYKYLSDADPKNTFDVEMYMSRRLKLRADGGERGGEKEKENPPQKGGGQSINIMFLSQKLLCCL